MRSLLSSRYGIIWYVSKSTHPCQSHIPFLTSILQQFELASRLVGVYKVNHMTRSVTIENRDYIAR